MDPGKAGRVNQKGGTAYSGDQQIRGSGCWESAEQGISKDRPDNPILR
jgi:hypothetical protein